mmetsp:Transcript_117980/g.334606  ORF Transcript_117980/g.334606 Transcript_117980/m.334606 type:complete len:455 (-) Transcript_117980:367-1731(-)
MSQRSPVSPSAPSCARLGIAGVLSLKTPRGAGDARSADRIIKHVEKQCRGSVREEWRKVDDRQLNKMREMLDDLKEENQRTQLLKIRSENAKVRKALESTRTNVDARLQACREKEAVAMERQAAHRRHVADNEKSLQEMQARIDKNEGKESDERENCKRLDQEIQEVYAELADQEVVKDSELRRIEQTFEYKQFLEMVVAACEVDFENDPDALINRYGTLEAGNGELHQVNVDLTNRLDREREESLRVATKLQNEHLMISSRLPEFQVTLDKHHAECQALQQRLHRSLEEKGLKDSQIGVIQMAIEQLFTRAVNSCRQKQRKKAMVEAVESRYGGLSRKDRPDGRLDRMLKQIIERVEDLKDMSSLVEKLARDTHQDKVAAVDDVDVMDRVKFVKQRGKPSEQRHDAASESSEPLNSGQLSIQNQLHSFASAASTSTAEISLLRQDTFVTQDPI